MTRFLESKMELWLPSWIFQTQSSHFRFWLQLQWFFCHIRHSFDTKITMIERKKQKQLVTLEFMAILKLPFFFKKVIFAQNTPPRNNGIFQKRTHSTSLQSFSPLFLSHKTLSRDWNNHNWKKKPKKQNKFPLH